MKKTLYAKDARNDIRVWEIEALDDGLHISHGVLHGQMQEEHEPIDIGLASRSVEEQIDSRFNSRVSKKIDSGYTESLEDARTKERTNSLGFSKPMLAAKFKDVKLIDYENMFVQHKYDGNRMLVRNEGGVNIAYSRQGKIIDTISEILDGMTIPEGVTLDGEIYCHGESLQTIVSWVKKRQEDSLRLRFHVYDVLMPDFYEKRFDELMSFNLGDRAGVVPTYLYTGQKSISSLLKDSISKGYEGLILRQNCFGYESGKRSKSLIKVKQFEDGEFEIVDIQLSDRGIPVMECMTEFGVVFKATAPGTHEQKMKIYERRREVIGMYTHVEYAQLTKDNVPFHGVATEILKHEDFNK